MKVLLENRKARLEYTVVQKFEAGIQLFGHEVKMLRTRRGSLTGAHIRVVNDEAILLNAQIPLYPFARDEEYDPRRTRRLLLHRKEILTLQQAQETKGLALIPLAIGVEGKRIKVELAIARGKKLYERREELKKRDIERDAQRSLKEKVRF